AARSAVNTTFFAFFARSLPLMEAHVGARSLPVSFILTADPHVSHRAPTVVAFRFALSLPAVAHAPIRTSPFCPISRWETGDPTIVPIAVAAAGSNANAPGAQISGVVLAWVESNARAPISAAAKPARERRRIRTREDVPTRRGPCQRNSQRTRPLHPKDAGAVSTERTLRVRACGGRGRAPAPIAAAGEPASARAGGTPRTTRRTRQPGRAPRAGSRSGCTPSS